MLFAPGDASVSSATPASRNAAETSARLPGFSEISSGAIHADRGAATGTGGSETGTCLPQS
jgi:hypothetical protein